jgi:hypothetical protein
VHVIIKLGTAGCAINVNKGSPTATAFEYFYFVLSALLCPVIKTTIRLLPIDGGMRYPWMDAEINGVPDINIRLITRQNF